MWDALLRKNIVALYVELSLKSQCVCVWGANATFSSWTWLISECRMTSARSPALLRKKRDDDDTKC